MTTQSCSLLYTATPTAQVLDNRNLPIRKLQYHRHPDTPSETNERITYQQYEARGLLTQSMDPRLAALQAQDGSVLANFQHQPSLLGDTLRTDSVDAGSTVALNDIAGQSLLAVGATGVTYAWDYEDDSLPGRPLAIREQSPGEATRIVERRIWAGSTSVERSANLAGQCVRHYDTAGMIQIDSVALTGNPLSVTRQFLADSATVDWHGEHELAWSDLLASDPAITRNTLDALGGWLTSTDAQGNQQRFMHDLAGRLKGSWLTLKDGQEQVIVKSLTSSAAGQKLREAHGNGVLTHFAYDSRTQRLRVMTTERPFGHGAGAKVLQDLHYDYDPVGNVLSIGNAAEVPRFWRQQKVEPLNTYTYDSLYQLVSTAGREVTTLAKPGTLPLSITLSWPRDDSVYTNYTRSYTYDTAGNLTQIRHSSPAINNNYTTAITISNRSNRGVLSTLTQDPFTVDELFDAGGHQCQLQPRQTLNWTARGELLSVTPVERDGQSGDIEHYRYDSGSQRLLKVRKQMTLNGTQVQRVLYLPGVELRTSNCAGVESENLHIITIGNTARAPVRLLHWVCGLPDGISNDSLRYSYANLTGSSGLEVDGAGNIISLEEYYPYGGTAVWAARSQVEAPYKTVRYSGKERDATGLYYYGFRYYQPWVGRWLSPDPAGAVDGLNLFSMIANNPVTFFDTDGLIKTGQAAKDLVDECFVHPLHRPVFEKVSLDENLAISVREAGIHTITALGEGAAAKGHDILEKTIKRSSLSNIYGDHAESAITLAAASGFLGRVGQWGTSGVRGIYAYNKVSDENHPYPISLEHTQKNELVSKWIKHGILTPYTGDYDMHDVIHVENGRGRIPAAGSAEEKRIIDLINFGVDRVDPSRPFAKTAMNVVRHGPQVNFVSYMWQYEHEKVIRDNGYSGVVARPGPFPVAMVYQGQWTLYENSTELFEFYSATNTAVPSHWAQPLIERGSGFVATPEHAKILNNAQTPFKR
ncbi:RHS repeat-associated core domain-containing protein [Pseudomonas sp. HS6-2]|uniref:RHS repeat-associated core domain-containing protein n=1 Tax=Pseudomonas sp. HS6-2 TaxID=3410986 RepID=UPI003BCD0D18